MGGMVSPFPVMVGLWQRVAHITPPGGYHLSVGCNPDYSGGVKQKNMNWEGIIYVLLHLP